MRSGSDKPVRQSRVTRCACRSFPNTPINQHLNESAVPVYVDDHCQWGMGYKLSMLPNLVITWLISLSSHLHFLIQRSRSISFFLVCSSSCQATSRTSESPSFRTRGPRRGHAGGTALTARRTRPFCSHCPPLSTHL